MGILKRIRNIFDSPKPSPIKDTSSLEKRNVYVPSGPVKQIYGPIQEINYQNRDSGSTPSSPSQVTQTIAKGSSSSRSGSGSSSISGTLQPSSSTPNATTGSLIPTQTTITRTNIPKQSIAPAKLLNLPTQNNALTGVINSPAKYATVSTRPERGDLQFKRDVLGKSGVYYALPYVGQQTTKLFSKVPVIGSRIKEADKIPAPAFARNIVYSAGPSLLFAPAMLSTSQFKADLIGRGAIKPTEETFFISNVKLNQGVSKVTTKSFSKIGGKIKTYGMGEQGFKVGDDMFAGAGKSVSVTETMKQGKFGFTGDVQLVGGKTIGKSGDITATYSSSLNKNVLKGFIDKGKINYLKPSKTLTTSKYVGFSKPVNENTFFYLGSEKGGGQLAGFVKVQGESSKGFLSSLNLKTFVSKNIAPTIPKTPSFSFQVPKMSQALVSSVSAITFKPATATPLFTPQKTSSIQSTKQSIIPMAVPLQNVMPKQNEIQMFKPVAISKSIQTPKGKLATKQTPKVLQVPKVSQTPLVDVANVPKLKNPLNPRTKTIPRMANPITANPFVDFPKGGFVPPLWLPKFRFDGGRIGTRKLGAKARRKYTPSFSAIVFNIRGKAPKSPFKMALGVRPITKGFKWSF